MKAAKVPALPVSAPVQVTVSQLGREVWYSDNSPSELTQLQIQAVVDITCRKVGLVCLGGRALEVDLGQGFVLVCQVRSKGVT